MEFIRITAKDHLHWEHLMAIYEGSFPIFEQRTMADQVAVLRDEQYHCVAVCEQDLLVGLLFYWEFGQYQYIEHLAIAPNLRGKNYGSRLLKEFCDNEHTIILEIDPPVDEVSIKRLRFYSNLGFKLQEFKHIHPPYRRGYEGHHLKVLSYNKDLSSGEYHMFNTFLVDRIMKYSQVAPK